MAKKFPKQLFVRQEDAGNGELYFVANETVEEIADVGVELKVAVYQLVEKRIIATQVLQRRMR